MSRRPVLHALLFAAGLVPSSAVASEATLKTFDVCLQRVRAVPYNRTREDVDWQALKAKWRPEADAAEPGEELREVLNAMLAEVGASHTAVLDGDVYDGMVHELNGLPFPTFGLLLEEMEPGRLFVRAMYEQGPAERAGLELGDEICEVASDPPLESPAVVDAGYDPGPDKTRLYSLRSKPSEGDAEAQVPTETQVIEVKVRSARNGKPRVVRLVTEATSGLEAGRRSIRVVEHDGARIGILHLWLVARGSGELVQEALRGELAHCDALIVDLRGRGGLADEIARILAPFRAGRAPSKAGQSGEGGQGEKGEQGSEGRRGRPAKSVAPDLPRWTRPVVFLVDDRTRSAKEITAWWILHDALGPLVGEKTEGAVLAAGFIKLPGGLYLEVGMVPVPVADGTSLEGRGVEPTHPVRHHGPFAGGVDPILAKGLELAAAAAEAVTLRRLGPY